jgi:hypothetical protein
MIKIKTNIIPSKSIYVGEKKTLNHKAICVFAATGFFLDQDTYYNELITLKPGYEYEITDDYKTILSQKQYFKWHYTPIEKSFNTIVNEFESLFETIISEQVKDKKVILPLSGGLDSRSQAVALYHLKNKVNSYGYAFQNGHDETKYGKQIAQVCDFPFQDWKVPNGYLWNKIEQLATINQCYSEFTHPRQMAFIEQYANLGDVFSLGHWGDVLFDDMNVPDDLSFQNQVEIIIKKIIKKGGLELAEELWNSWDLDGNFKEYLYNRVEFLLKEINITTNANASIRAFKSLYWAPRWTSTNLSIFESVKPISVPYYDNRMCEFICSIPEKYLAKRQIQIEYIKKRMPQVAKITWQDHRPFNLFNYHYNKNPFNLPFRVFNKLKRTLLNKKYTQRNWELQFIGKENESKLEQYLFNNESFLNSIDKQLVENFYKKFKTENSVKYSHAVSMLLTLSLFFKIIDNEK